MTNADYFLEIYMAVKKTITRNPYLRIPNSEKFIEGIQKAADIIEEIYADPLDFMKFMIKYYAPMRIFPQPGHIIAKAIVNKYRYHQALINAYRYSRYSTDRKVMLIHETMETVDYGDIMSPTGQDSRIRYTLHILKEGEDLNKISYNDIIYSILKLELLHLPIPDELWKAKEGFYATI